MAERWQRGGSVGDGGRRDTHSCSASASTCALKPMDASESSPPTGSGLGEPGVGEPNPKPSNSSSVAMIRVAA